MTQLDRNRMGTRGAILKRLRAVVPKPDQSPDAEGFAARPVRRFDWSPAELRAQFEQQLRAARAEVLQVRDDWPHVLAQQLEASGVRNLRYGHGAPLATALSRDWPSSSPVRLVEHQQPIEQCRDALFEQTDAAITGCKAGIAETGSLVLWPTPEEPRLLSLVPPLHVALLEETQLFSTLHEAMTTEDWAAGMPTNALLISGPSKSADIEQTLAYGVHGPARLLVLLHPGQGRCDAQLSAGA